jgi:hypothetical protein
VTIRLFARISVAVAGVTCDNGKAFASAFPALISTSFSVTISLTQQEGAFGPSASGQGCMDCWRARDLNGMNTSNSFNTLVSGGRKRVDRHLRISRGKPL